MKKLLFTIFFLPTFCFAMPSYPMSFWGNINIDNSPAPVGTIIYAYYSTSTLAGEITVNESGVYGYNDSLKQKLLTSEGSGPITFEFQIPNVNNGLETTGASIQSYGSFSSGTTINENLNFTTQTQTVTQQPVVSSGGGGGGGGGSSYTPPVIPTTIKGDSNGDDKVDILDFNALLIQWGKTGSNLTADFDKNGVVDIFDFNLLLINWSK